MDITLWMLHMKHYRFMDVTYETRDLWMLYYVFYIRSIKYRFYL